MRLVPGEWHLELSAYGDVTMRIEDLDRMRSSVYIMPDSHSLRTIAEVRERLERGESMCVRLEPGDGTRYEFLLTPFFPDAGPRIRHALLVTRVISSDVIGSRLIFDWAGGMDDYNLQIAGMDLSNGNTWSEQIFRWWLDLLCNPDR